MGKNLFAARGIEKEIFLKFKAKAVEEKISIGKALNLAMMEWLNKKDGEKVDPKNFLKLKPFDWGRGTEKTSKEIDKTLYGEEE